LGGVRLAVATLVLMAEPRQAVKYTFLKVSASTFAWEESERAAAAAEMASILEDQASRAPC
jgi:hypothetical protein